jgi:hypothetical protein
MDTGSGYRGRIPFEPLQLTFEEQERCQELTMQLLDQTLRSYDDRLTATNTNGSPAHHSNMDSARWKRFKTQPSMTLYSQRDHRGPRDLNIPGGNWENPTVLLAVGTIEGSLDDVMLGLSAQSFADIQLRAASIASQDARGAMLAKLSGPTEEDPFHCMSVVWMVREQRWPMNLVVSPRDFVSLSASGVITTASGERIGYELSQPAQLPQCPALSKRVTRGKLMYGALYRELDGMVDVYIQLQMETTGSIANAVFMNRVWRTAHGLGRALHLSEEKKLEWCILNSMVERAAHKPPREEERSERAVCARCNATIARWKRGQDEGFQACDACAVCTSLVCPGCCVKRSLTIPTGHIKRAPTRSLSVTVCRECLGLVRRQNAAKVAWSQYQHRLLYSVSDTCSSDRPVWGLADDTLMYGWSPERYFSISDIFPDEV